MYPIAGIPVTLHLKELGDHFVYFEMTRIYTSRTREIICRLSVLYLGVSSGNSTLILPSVNPPSLNLSSVEPLIQFLPTQTVAQVYLIASTKVLTVTQSQNPGFTG